VAVKNPSALVHLAAFASGAAVMAVEMSAVRAIQPFFGSTVHVWTNVIAVVLTAITLGCACGGRLADRRPSPALFFGLVAAGGAILVVVAHLVTPVSRLFLEPGVNLEGVMTVRFRGSLAAALTLFAPPLVILGAVTPFAVRLIATHGVGRAAGGVFAVATAGSILGTILPTLWLVPAIGSRTTILAAAGLLVATGAYGLLRTGRPRTAAAFAMALAVVGAKPGIAPDRGPPELMDGGRATVIIGMACGVNASQWKHFWGSVYDLTVDGAEIDPEIVGLGREHFGMAGAEDGWLRVVAMDGRQMLAALPDGTRYDMLVVDAFTNELYIPFHLATREFFSLCRSRLAPGGVLAMNVYAVGEDAPNLRAIENTMATVFGHAVRAAQYGGENFLLLAANQREPPDVLQLDPVRVRRRFRAWEGYREWTDRPEWSDLLSVGERLAKDCRRIEPRDDEWVLTDDHAPIESLTHRFLERVEERELEADDPRGVALRRLLDRQRNALLVIGALWAVTICAIMTGLRKGK
jgi:hypothetical protein